MAVGREVPRCAGRWPDQAQRLDNCRARGRPVPEKTQRLLNRAVWDTAAAIAAIRRFTVHAIPAEASPGRPVSLVIPFCVWR